MLENLNVYVSCLVKLSVVINTLLVSMELEKQRQWSITAYQEQTTRKYMYSINIVLNQNYLLQWNQLDSDSVTFYLCLSQIESDSILSLSIWNKQRQRPITIYSEQIVILDKYMCSISIVLYQNYLLEWKHIDKDRTGIVFYLRLSQIDNNESDRTLSIWNRQKWTTILVYPRGKKKAEMKMKKCKG